MLPCLSAHDGAAGPLVPGLGEDEVHAVGHLHADPQPPPLLLLQAEAALAGGVLCELVGSLHAVLINTGGRDCLATISSRDIWLKADRPDSFLMFTLTGPSDHRQPLSCLDNWLVVNNALEAEEKIKGLSCNEMKVIKLWGRGREFTVLLCGGARYSEVFTLWLIPLRPNTSHLTR